MIPITLLRQFDIVRLIPSRFRPAEGGLRRLASDPTALQILAALTSDIPTALRNRLPGIGLDELVAHIPGSDVINASFIHANPAGSRFNGPDRGVWYAALTLEAAQAEVAHHKAIEYAEINRFDDSVTYDAYLGDFSAVLHDLRNDPAFADYLDPDSYTASQTLGQQQLDSGSLGIIYPSVRHAGGTCVACFRPALVGNVRRDASYRFIWSGTRVPAISRV